MDVTAAYVNRLGDTARIRYGRLNVAGPGPQDVLICTHALSVNPVDTFVRAGKFLTAVPLPLILGRDVVGTVISAPAWSGLAQGEWVWANSLGYDGRQGSYADVVVAPESRVYRLPEGVDPLAAVALAHPASTAAMAVAKASFAPGDLVFIGGGGGNVGGAAVALAAGAGAVVVATASAVDAQRVRAAGAHDVVDHHDANALADAIERYRGRAQVVWDTSGKMDYGTLADLAGIGGTILVTAAGEEAVPVAWAGLYTKDITVRGFAHSRASEPELARAARIVNRFLAQGAFDPRITEVVPLSQAAAVHGRMEKGEIRGRVVLRP